MIREVFENKVIDNMDYVIEIINAYFGGKYKEEFLKRANNISVSLVRSKGVIKINKEERYVGEEAICIKEDDCSQIIMPISFLEEKHGNVIFVHLLLHSLFNDSLKNENDEVNEVIVDYIANDIAKILERKNINVTLVEEPVYESCSLYSKCFDMVSDYVEENKRELVEAMVNGNASELYGIDELSDVVNERINSLLFEEETVKKIKK